MWQDDIVEEIRAVREAHAKQYNYDLRAIFRALKVEEQQSGRKIVALQPKRTILLQSSQVPPKQKIA